MKVKISAVFLISVLTSFSTGSYAKSIDNRDAFEKEYIKCFKEGLGKGCFKSEFSGLLDYRVRNQEVIEQINDSLVYWMSDRKIYDVYKVQSEVKAQIYDTRTYLIEQDNGNIMGVAVGFIRVAGEWKIFEMQVSNKHKFLQHVLSLPDYSND